MTTIEVKINDDLLKVVSTEYISDYINGQLDFLKLKSLAIDINNSIEKSEIDFELEMKKSKHEAWEEYKKSYLDGIINE